MKNILEFIASFFKRNRGDMFPPEISGGGIQSPPDYRDIPLAAVADTTALPDNYKEDLNNNPVWHQRKIGSCVGHAGAKYKQHLDNLDTSTIGKHSARFLYAVAKARDGYPGEGTYPRLVAKIVKDHGCATEDTVPNVSTLTHEQYVYNRNEKNIPSASFDDATKHKISGYAFADVKNAESLKRAIYTYHGAMLLMRIGREWWTAEDGKSSWAAKDIVPIRPPKNVVGGHEVFVYGYETEKDTGRVKFFIRNSWSAAWAINGDNWFYHDEWVNRLDEAITFVDIPNKMLELIDELPDADNFKHTFSTPLRYRQRNDEVKQLQTALMIDGTFSRDLYSSLLKTDELGYYGVITSKAVLAFQRKYNVASTSELDSLMGRIVGPKTRRALNKIFA